MEQRAAHPLNIDLLAYALGEVDAEPAAELEQHLGQCLLCRIHLNRIRQGGLELGPDATATLRYPEIAPTVLGMIEGGRRPASIEPGQLWIAGTSSRMLLWIEAINRDARMATVLAASLDVDAADHTSLIVAVPELDRDVAIFTSVPGWIPIDRFSTFVSTIDVTEEIAELSESLEEPIERIDSGTKNAARASDRRRKKQGAQLRVGMRISDGSDERLEFRQLLADQLANLYGEDDGGEYADDDPISDLSQVDSIVADMRQKLTENLISSREGPCDVRVLDEYLAGSFARSMPIRPVATVQELDCVMLVFATDFRHEDFGFKPEDAYKLLLDSGASSLAVAEPRQPYPTQIFVLSGLRPAYEIPRAIGHVDPRPLWEPRPLIQAVLDYLQSDVFPIESQPIASTRTPPVLLNFLPRQSLAAINELKGMRAQKGKLRALKSLDSEDATALQDALATAGHIDELVARIEEITLQ
jgi:hypothetical protein